MDRLLKLELRIKKDNNARQLACNYESRFCPRQPWMIERARNRQDVLVRLVHLWKNRAKGSCISCTLHSGATSRQWRWDTAWHQSPLYCFWILEVIWNSPLQTQSYQGDDSQRVVLLEDVVLIGWVFNYFDFALPRMTLSGRFLLWEQKAKSDWSYFFDSSSTGVMSSNGLKGCFCPK